MRWLYSSLSTTIALGLIVFFAKNWLLIRLKASVLNEYSESFETFKNDLVWEKCLVDNIQGRQCI
ncbi:MAG: hypothetical protein ACJAVV_003998 [Alphaproteobacteria bacterium]|jgi:hypothetical protein